LTDLMKNTMHMLGKESLMKYLQLFLLLLFVFSGGLLYAQQLDLDENVPMNSKVRTGKLANGLTYYVMHNEEPKERASFYMIQNVGAILENDDQNGLAHFLEHMAFNGSENYPEEGITKYLEQYGVAFGGGINAGTGHDETVYNITNVPVMEKGVLDACLLILHDWSNYLLLEDEKIDAERGVIKEEWRTRRDAMFRMQSKMMPVLFQDSKYAVRDIIGSLDVIGNHKYETLRRFYRDWYRTDLQAIAIVGDLDVDQVESKIKELFTEIPANENKKERKNYTVPGHDKPRVAIITDPENPMTVMLAFFKHDATKPEKKNLAYLRRQYVNNLYNNMIRARLEELTQQADPPYMMAESAYQSFLRTLDTYMIVAVAKNNEGLRAFEAALTENERVKRHGFTATELARAKANLLNDLDQSYKTRDKKAHDSFCYEIMDHYLTNSPMPGIEFEFDFAKKVIPTITVEEVSSSAKKWIRDENLVFVAQGPQREDVTMPSEKEILAVYEKVKTKSLKPYEDEVVSESLISEDLEGSSVASIKELKEFKATEWTLGNGLKVVIKPTDLHQNQILMSAFSWGGSSLYTKKDLPSATVVGEVVPSFGVGAFDMISMNKALTGKTVSVNPFLSSTQEGFKGGSSIEDFETMLQLAYLYFTKPRYDENLFTAFKTNSREQAINAKTDPMNAFFEKVQKIVSDNHPRVMPRDETFVDQYQLATIKRIYADRFKDAGDFIFFFTGNIDPEKHKPLIEKYLGALKDDDRTECFKDNNVHAPKGFVKEEFQQKMDTSKSTVFVNYSTEAEYQYANAVYLAIFRSILDLRFMESIRKQEGGTYGVQVMQDARKHPFGEYTLSMMFDCDPAKVDRLKKLIYIDIDKLIKEGPTKVDLDTVKTNLLKIREEALKNNSFWHSALMAYYQKGVNIIADKAFTDFLKNITGDDVKKAAQELLGKANKIEIVMKPKK